jgi:hypothetical protein
MTVYDYLDSCRENCSDRISDKALFGGDALQANALRVESMRDTSPRCGLKPPIHWAQGAKDRGFGMWCYSGGSAAVYGHCACDMRDCPKLQSFLRTAPRAELRKYAAQAGEESK